MSTNDLDALKQENEQLRSRNAVLEKEISFLRTHPVFLQGIKGESLVADLTGGQLTSFAARHDVEIPGVATIEVKMSKLNTPVRGGRTRRWNWSNPLGWRDKGKVYDFLILVGEKDPRYPDQYLDDSPYIFFLVPRARVVDVCVGGKTIGTSVVGIISNLAAAKSPASTHLKRFIESEKTVSAVFSAAATAPPPV